MSLNKNIADFLIVGGGVIGVTLARALSIRYPNTHIKLLEKEKEVSMHTSGRNSGVLHAGFYYSSETLKAQFCRAGNQMWTEYCDQYNLPIRKCGKLVVPKNDQEVEYMKDLYQQGLKNKVPIEMITREEALKIDPLVRGYGKEFIWSPITSTVDTKSILKHMVKEINDINPNFEIIKETELLEQKQNNPGQVLTKKGDKLNYKYLINAAGQQSLGIAQSYGFGNDFDYFPIKGIYSISDRPLDHLYKTLVYPVPLKGAYFLGVHSTLTVDGYLKVGPTVSPAFSLENYHGLQNLNFNQFRRIITNYLHLLASDQRKLIWTFITEEMPKHSIKRLVHDVSKIHHIGPEEAKTFKEFYRPGIRAQLINKKSMKMHNDFILEFGDNMNLKAIIKFLSPGWTCALPVADHITNEISKKLVHE